MPKILSETDLLHNSGQFSFSQTFENAYSEQKEACEVKSDALADARIIELEKFIGEREQKYHKEKCTLKSQVSNLFYLISALLHGLQLK